MVEYVNANRLFMMFNSTFYFDLLVSITCFLLQTGQRSC